VTRPLAERLEHARVNADGDQLPGFFPERRPTHAAHRRQLLRRRVRNIGAVNPSTRTPPARAGSPAARKKNVPKRVLALPDLEYAKSTVLNSLTSRSGQRTYHHAIREFVAW